MQKIVIYRMVGKTEWQMCRAGDTKNLFYTASRRPKKFTDWTEARTWMRACKKWAENNLGWNAIWDVVPLEDFKAFA